MLQSAAVRSAGFVIVSLGETAPALQALFVCVSDHQCPANRGSIMMYIA